MCNKQYPICASVIVHGTEQRDLFRFQCTEQSVVYLMQGDINMVSTPIHCFMLICLYTFWL
jgi:hypothetical protein